MQNTVGSRFKYVRKMLNMSQEMLANILDITKQAVSNIENSKSMPSIQIMSKLAIKYSINLNYLVAGIGDMYINTNNENYKNLRQTLLDEVDNYLKARGIS